MDTTKLSKLIVIAALISCSPLQAEVLPSEFRTTVVQTGVKTREATATLSAIKTFDVGSKLHDKGIALVFSLSEIGTSEISTNLEISYDGGRNWEKCGHRPVRAFTSGDSFNRVLVQWYSWASLKKAGTVVLFRSK